MGRHARATGHNWAKMKARICGAMLDRQGRIGKNKARIFGARPDRQGRLELKLRLGFVAPFLIARAYLGKNEGQILSRHG